jgi:hypothetical protein
MKATVPGTIVFSTRSQPEVEIREIPGATSDLVRFDAYLVEPRAEIASILFKSVCGQLYFCWSTEGETGNLTEIYGLVSPIAFPGPGHYVMRVCDHEDGTILAEGELAGPAVPLPTESRDQ